MIKEPTELMLDVIKLKELYEKHLAGAEELSSRAEDSIVFDTAIKLYRAMIKDIDNILDKHTERVMR